MRPSTPILAALVLLGSSLAANAADITYNVTGTLDDSAKTAFSGQYEVNSTTNVIDGASFTVDATGGNLFFSDNTPGTPGTLYDPSSFLLNLHYPNAVNTDQEYSSGYSFFVINGGNDPVYSATSVISATPEPSSLILLGSGALGLVGAVRRRVMA